MNKYPYTHPNDAPRNEVPLGAPPGPIPVRVTVNQIETPQGPLALLRFYTAPGRGAYLLPMDEAKKVEQIINERATIVHLT